MAKFFKASPKKQPAIQVKQKAFQYAIQRLDNNGCGVAKDKYHSIFIEGSLPGEKVTARIVEQKNKFTKAKLITIEQPSQDRVIAKCPHFLVCGGCDLQHLSFKNHLEFKQQKVVDLFSRASSLSATKQTESQLNLPWQPSISSDAWHYRRKARIGVQFNKQGQATIGFRQKGSNQLTPIRSCSVLVEPLSDIFPQLKKLLAELTIKKAIGHIEVIATDHITLVVRQLKIMNRKDIQIWLSYAQQFNWQIVVDSGDDIVELTPVISVSPLCGIAIPLSYPLTEHLVINFSVGDFIQVNHKVNLKMVEQAINWLALKPTDIVLDLFCGLGNFSLAIAQKTFEVIGVEGVQTMVDKAQLNANSNLINNCQFYQANLNDDWLTEPWALKKYDKVLLDPARAGAENAIKQVSHLRIPHVLYVSCEPATLVRDAQILIAQGYQLVKIGLIEMFAQTKHVETMVYFYLPSSER